MKTKRMLLLAVLLVLASWVGFRESSSGTEPGIRTFEFTYITELTGIPAGAGELSAWIPYPQSDGNQKITDVRVQSPYPTRLTRDPEYGNQILFIHITQPKGPSAKIEMSFKVQRREYVRQQFDVAKASTRDVPEPQLKRWLQPDHLVPLDGRIRDLALEITRGKTTDLEKARAIYDYAVANLKYDKSGTGWGRGDIYYACDVKRGNCTDFHAVFIGFARAVGIPATFEIGFPLPPDRNEGEIAGYHCWAQFYLKGYGWVPVDASDGSRNPARRDYFFGAHDEHRVLFTLGRDVRLNPAQKGEPLNYFIYPYVEVDGKPWNNIQKKFYFKDAS